MRDYLAGSKIAGWIQAAAGRLRSSGKGLAQQALQGPTLLSLLAAWKATPVKVAGVLMTTVAVTNLAALWLLRKSVPWEGTVWRVGFAILGIACTTQRSSGEKIREGSWIIRTLDRLRSKPVGR